MCTHVCVCIYGIFWPFQIRSRRKPRKAPRCSPSRRQCQIRSAKFTSECENLVGQPHRYTVIRCSPHSQYHNNRNGEIERGRERNSDWPCRWRRSTQRREVVVVPSHRRRSKTDSKVAYMQTSNTSNANIRVSTPALTR